MNEAQQIQTMNFIDSMNQYGSTSENDWSWDMESEQAELQAIGNELTYAELKFNSIHSK